VTATYRFDVTKTVERIEELRNSGNKVGLNAYIAKATAKTLAKHPRLNTRLFHGFFGPREATYNSVNCGMIANRLNQQGEDILVPIVIREADKCSVQEIHQMIKTYKTAPLETLDSYQALSKIKKLPRFLISFLHFLFRRHPRYSAKSFSTYVISSVLTPGLSMVGIHNIGNQTVFFPSSLEAHLALEDGVIVAKKMLWMAVCIDHYLVDGMDVQKAVLTLKTYLEDPDSIFDESP